MGEAEPSQCADCAKKCSGMVKEFLEFESGAAAAAAGGGGIAAAVMHCASI